MWSQGSKPLECYISPLYIPPPTTVSHLTYSGRSPLVSPRSGWNTGTTTLQVLQYGVGKGILCACSEEIDVTLLFTRLPQGPSVCESFDIFRSYTSSFSSIRVKYRQYNLASVTIWCWKGEIQALQPCKCYNMVLERVFYALTVRKSILNYFSPGRPMSICV